MRPVYLIIHGSLEKNVQWAYVGSCWWPAFWTISSDPWIWKHFIRTRTEGIYDVKTSFILFHQHFVGIAEQLKGCKCPWFDNNRCLWLFHLGVLWTSTLVACTTQNNVAIHWLFYVIKSFLHFLRHKYWCSERSRMVRRERHIPQKFLSDVRNWSRMTWFHTWLRKRHLLSIVLWL